MTGTMSKKLTPPATLHGQAAVLIRKYISQPYIRQVIRLALEEDLGPGDITGSIFDTKSRGRAVLLARQDGILSGSYLVDAVFRQLHRGTQVNWHISDSKKFKKNDTLATITGPMTALLQGERVALNFLQRMCGVATLTQQYVNSIARGKNKPKIYDTRKTTPLLRAFEKKAVVDGGGSSHRFALYDMAMLKNNHIDAAGGISEAVEKLAAEGFYARRPRLGRCIEARSQNEAVEATWVHADIVMLDNMTPAQVKRAAEAVRREAKALKITPPELEISGGITLKNIKRYSGLPVQRISIGALTHSAPALDISMRYLD